MWFSFLFALSRTSLHSFLSFALLPLFFIRFLLPFPLSLSLFLFLPLIFYNIKLTREIVEHAILSALFLYYAFHFRFLLPLSVSLSLSLFFSFSHLAHYSSPPCFICSISYFVHPLFHSRSSLISSLFHLLPKIKEAFPRQVCIPLSLFYPASLFPFSHLFQLLRFFMIPSFHTSFRFSNQGISFVFLSCHSYTLPFLLFCILHRSLLSFTVWISQFSFLRTAFRVSPSPASLFLSYFFPPSVLFTLSCLPSVFYVIILCSFRLPLTIKLSLFSAVLLAFIFL